MRENLRRPPQRDVAEEVSFIQELVSALKSKDVRKKREMCNLFYKDYGGTIRAYTDQNLRKRGFTYYERTGKPIEDEGGDLFHDGSLCDEVVNDLFVYLLADTYGSLSNYRGDNNAKFTTYIGGVCKLFIQSWFSHPERYPAAAEWTKKEVKVEDSLIADEGLHIEIHRQPKKTSEAKEFSEGDQEKLWNEELVHAILEEDREKLSSPREASFEFSIEEVCRRQKILQFGMVKAMLLLSKTHPADARLVIMEFAGLKRKDMVRVLGKPTSNAVSQAKNEAKLRFVIAYKQVLRRTYGYDIDKEDVKDELKSIIAG